MIQQVQRGEISADVTDGCVSIDMFAPSLYNGIIGEFATQAERDYLFDDRENSQLT